LTIREVIQTTLIFNVMLLIANGVLLFKQRKNLGAMDSIIKELEARRRNSDGLIAQLIELTDREKSKIH